MGLLAEQKEYYESESQRKILYIANLSQFLDKLNQQVLRLPHEMNDPNSNYPIGSTEEQIINSIIRGVEMAYVMLVPYRRLISTIQNKPHEFSPSSEYQNKTAFYKAMEKLEWCYLLMEEADILNDRVIQINLPEDEDIYLDGEDKDDPFNERYLPASIDKPMEAAVGPLEVENP